MWMLFLQGTYHTPAAVSYTSLAILVSLSWWYKLIEVLLPGESLASLVKGKVVCGGCDGLNSLPRTSNCARSVPLIQNPQVIPVEVLPGAVTRPREKSIVSVSAGIPGMEKPAVPKFDPGQ